MSLELNLTTQDLDKQEKILCVVKDQMYKMVITITSKLSNYYLPARLPFSLKVETNLANNQELYSHIYIHYHVQIHSSYKRCHKSSRAFVFIVKCYRKCTY